MHRTITAVTSLLLLTITGAVNSSVTSAATDTTPQFSKVTPAPSAGSLAHWTPDRMRTARPLQPALADELSTAASAPPSTSFGPRKVDPVRASRRSIDAGPQAHDPHYPVGHPTASTNGRLFFRRAGGYRVCSAAVIASDSRSTVWTAAECLRTGGPAGSWATDVVFVPNYDDTLANPRPYGTWVAAKLVVPIAWSQQAVRTHNLGVVVLAPLNGQKIQDVVGAQGLQVNAGQDVWQNSFGYPGGAPLDGGNLKRCWGQTTLAATTGLLKIPCDMTLGADGGPWLHSWDQSFGYLNGINVALGNGFVESPYFADQAWSLYTATQGG
ncbi:hypothetical protein AB0P21_40210 [Kribbella sp. NPDC056861]|uniref:trypsin-like serine peptidase n=1 Tax=Kribbella sp. NPDC056861 TaxID=3154857 RepID=UPI0034339FAA